MEITKGQLLQAFGAMTVALASKDEEEIKRNSVLLNEAIAKASPELIAEMKNRPNAPTFGEMVTTVSKLLDLGKDVAQLVQRLRGL